MQDIDNNCDGPVHVLIVEDSATQAARLRHTLEQHGYIVTSASNGREALSAARSHRPMLVMSDIVMPEMDGYELCRQIKADPALMYLPVILVTTLADLQDVVRGLECGADNFIVKPYEDRYLISRIQFVLLNRQIRCDTRMSIGVEIQLNGQHHVITADRLQILNLLLSTYEAAIQRNQELTRAKDDLRTANASLEATIKELAQANERLNVEIAERESAQQKLNVMNWELTRATKAAEDANQTKSAFLANMSHEIRTPMTAIIGYADLMLDPQQDHDARAEHARTIRRNGEHLLALLNDILDLSKIEAGKLLIENIECRPGRIVNEVVSLLRVRAAESQLTLKVRNEGTFPITIISDPTRLRQILLNLVGNAIKFTNKGSVEIVIKFEESAEAGALLRFDVIDTGIGMTPSQIGNLFQPFVQADSSTSRKFGGTGLGIAISKRLAEMLGGRIEVTSTVGCGSVFSLFINPGSLAEIQWTNSIAGSFSEEGPIDASQENVLKGSILLVDDNLDNRILLSLYLNRAGGMVALAENGRVGYEMALAAWQTDQPFDVILMDMQMPEVDGYEATRMLRSEGYTGVIIALTANAMSDDRTRCLQAGCTDYLCKPVRREDLLTAVFRRIPKVAVDPNTYIAPAESLQAHEKEPYSVDQSASIKSELTDEDLRPFLDAYVAQLSQSIAMMKTSLLTGDLESLYCKLHDLKGTGGLYGLAPISNAASIAVSKLGQHASLESVTTSVNELIDIIRRVEGFEEPRRETSQEASTPDSKVPAQLTQS